ncbi:MAG: hypothetical protein R3A44_00040 [Caldilineaceae bacterium]
MLIGVTKSTAATSRGATSTKWPLFDRALTATEISHLGQSPWRTSPVYDSIDNGIAPLERG